MKVIITIKYIYIDISIVCSILNERASILVVRQEDDDEKLSKNLYR